MLSSPRLLAAAFSLAVWVAVGASAPSALLPARQADTEEDLLARIQREHNPVKRAKYKIRLGRVKLFEAIEAYDKSDLERCQQLLGVYLEQMKDSWETLRTSGRPAVRQPQGFKELDIALREDARLLEDLRHRIPYSDRSAVEKTIREVERIRGEVLGALFPEQRPAARNSSAPLSRLHFSV